MVSWHAFGGEALVCRLPTSGHKYLLYPRDTTGHSWEEVCVPSAVLPAAVASTPWRRPLEKGATTRCASGLL